MEFISSTSLFSCVYFQVAVLSQAKFRSGRPPYFFQSIGNAVLEKLVKEKFQTAGAEQQSSITTQELNALKICSGL